MNEKKQITRLWIDESGDNGFKFEKGSSRFDDQYHALVERKQKILIEF